MTDFKLGDWVQYNGKVAKIVSINIYGECLIHYPDATVDNSALEKYLEPIPLTGDILLKNGWTEVSKGSDEYIYYFNDSPAYLRTCDNLVDSKLYTCPDYYPNEDISKKEIKYVHQLQHILWALGCDDDIKL